MGKKLCKSRTDMKLDGVCAGIAGYVEIDATIIRLVWVIGTLISFGMGVILYALCCFIMPREPKEEVHWEDQDRQN